MELGVALKMDSKKAYVGKEIGVLHAQNMLTILSLIVNIIKDIHMTI
jgi:hypothetical protein